MEPLQTFEYGSFKVETFYNGSNKLPNKTYINGSLVCEDQTFRPSPQNNIDDTDTMVSLLGFLTLRTDDVEQEYFEALQAPDLLAWSEESEEADEIRTMLYNWENREDKSYLLNCSLTKEECMEIENYITNH